MVDSLQWRSPQSLSSRYMSAALPTKRWSLVSISLNLGWPWWLVWLIKWGINDAVEPPRLGYKKFHSFFVDLLGCFLSESICWAVRNPHTWRNHVYEPPLAAPAELPLATIIYCQPWMTNQLSQGCLWLLNCNHIRNSNHTDNNELLF